MTSVKKIVIHRAGGHDQLKLEEHPLPPLAKGEVLVRTRAIGVNFADTCVRMGVYSSAKVYVGWPITPGFEFAGTVEAVGADVGDLAVGTEVFGISRFGAYATHVAVPRHQLFHLPRGLTMDQAAAVPAVYMSAYFALFELAHPHKNDTVLVHSAAGGVGTALLQLLRTVPCRAIGVVGASHKVEAAKRAGASEVIDKSKQPLWKEAERLAPEGYAIVLDANGVSTFKDSYRHLAPGGKLVVYGFHSMLPKKGGVPNWPKMGLDYLRTPRFNPFKLVDENRSVLAFNVSYLFHRTELLAEGMGKLIGWLEDGTILPPPVTTYPLAECAKAHQAIESAQTVGKLVLIP